MRKVPLEDIQVKKSSQIVDDLRHRRYSLLDSLGCRKLRREMAIPGFISRLIVHFLCRMAVRKDGENWPARVKRALIKLFDRFAKYELVGTMPENVHGMVIGFNHPSLGEILRLIGLVAKYYPNSRYLFPVNLPWYEALCPVIDQMQDVGFYLTPIITPSTRRKITKVADAEKAQIADSINVGFNRIYLDLCKEFVDNWDVILVAPSATRQATLFKTDAALAHEERIEPQTMSLLASTISRGSGPVDCRYQTIAVIPPANYAKGLNLCSTYKFVLGSSFTSNSVKQLCREKYGSGFNGRRFDYDFACEIGRQLFRSGATKLIAPLENERAINALVKFIKT